MESPELAHLREIALTLKLDPIGTIGHAASVSDVIQVLSGVKESYRNFLKIALSKKFPDNKNLDSEVDEFVNKTELLIVDTQFSSYQNSIAPNVQDNIYSLFGNSKEFSTTEQIFDDYKDEVIYSDVNSYHDLQTLKNKYSAVERQMIFEPLFKASSNKKFNVFVWEGNKEKRKIIKPRTEFQTYFKPPKKAKVEIPEKYYQFYAKVSESGEIINKSNIKDIVYYEALEHETYPFKPEVLAFGNYVFKLKEKLECSVLFEDNLYFIENESLDITVWAETREDVEKAFNFEFYSLYLNYALESEDKLTQKAILLKNKILKFN
ncbi:hypothetical protein EIH07_08120 [Chryseobacterium taklimakanense]|uniref:hypothetical protein n=1 Tax=Chryseobacterium taklimakanense TaxID=536441 RepID=UPI000F5D9A7B|nr:hypothetical protein [Chryseobacterium taklimakanense]AZI23002.1 hypothetical protein EIH07_08120 [Chryseobacterium taklimakanense]